MTLEKFKLLCWKNLTLQKRHPIAGLFEIIFPILVVLLFVYGRSHLDSEKINELKFQSFKPIDYRKCLMFNKFAVSPAGNPELTKLIESSVGSSRMEVEYFENSDSLNFYLNSQNDSLAAGIEFNNNLANSTSLPKKLEYSIRLPHNPSTNTWLTDQLYLIAISKAARDTANIPTFPPYYSYCFLTIQNDIERSFIKSASSSDPPPVILQRFPYPSVSEDIFIALAGNLFPLLFVICMLLSMKNIIKNITDERESQLKEMMKMMGLSSSLHWTAWFVKCFVMKQISIIIMTVLMCSTLVTQQPIFAHSNPIFIWMFLSIYAVSVITFCFLVSVIFKKSTTAANVGSIIFFITLIPFNRLNPKFYTFPYIIKILYCALVNSGMGQGMQILLVSEGNEVGLHFFNLFSREADTKFSMGEVILALILGIVIQMLLTVYIEKVFVGDIGIAEPWYYPFMPIFTCIRNRMGYNSLTNRDSMLQERRISGDAFEEEPTNLKAGIRIQNLSKSFGDKPVVNKLSLNIFEDQITALLGHNGAGKTTTMSLLTGLFPPSAGTAYLNGKDIRTEIDEARNSLGLCPQHNVLFEELTVKEHIIFFARLKGITDKRAIAAEVRRYVNLLELKDKVDAQSKTLSGGMKRKLCIGIALCGNSKIVICDEPSSGMDPAARRALWDLLISEKKGRTILISTHHMDEADVLGDRIAIMAEGRLRTVGSSFFLKKKFGTGYKLICVKESGCDINKLLEALRSYAPDTYIESDAQSEVIFVINENHLPIFQDIMKKLEDDSIELKISSFGCSLTTLEEVFLKLGTEALDSNEEDQQDSANHPSTTITMDDAILSSRKVSGLTLVAYQIQAMTLKKCLYLFRNLRSMLYMCILSIWLIVVFLTVPSLNFFSAPPLLISLSTYEETTSIIKYTGASNELAESYKTLLNGKDKASMISEDMQDFVLKKSNESISIFNQMFLVGASFEQNLITAWFNGQPYHTMPLTLNMINRAILRKSVGNDFDLSVTNKPYVWSQNSDDGNRIRGDMSGIVMPLILCFMLLTYWPTVFVAFYIKERSSRAKLLQLISGANRFVYWAASFLIDYLIYFIVICAIVAGIGAYQREHFKTFDELGSLLLIFAFYGFSTLPLVYAFSYLFEKHSSGESWVALGGFLLAIVYGLYAILKYLTEGAVWQWLAKIIYWIGLVFGPFSLLDSLISVGTSVIVPGASIFTEEIKRNMLMMTIGGVFFMAICLLKDHMLFDWFIYKFLTLPRKLQLPNQAMDSDVKQEVERIKNMSSSERDQGKLVLSGLSKFYGSSLAVNQLYLAVDSAECFGLLGINGAGKTTTFKMMTGDEIISSGEAYIRGLSVRNEMQKVHQQIGYCPQFDALLLDLTGRETLKIFSLIRGIPRQEINEVTNKLGHELGFQQHMDKKVSAFSGGNKRKLSTALALLGGPTLIFLDEPTTGMDPSAKRQLWNMINNTRNSGRSVVMTSHSMEECEALCTKLAIMVNGEFKCLGSTQHLKNKFSKGYLLTVKTGSDNDETASVILKRIQREFPSAEMKEKYMDILTFHITDNLKWSQMFSVMNQIKAEIGLNDYALTQTSLEQVFLFFTKSGIYQRDKTD